MPLAHLPVARLYGMRITTRLRQFCDNFATRLYYGQEKKHSLIGGHEMEGGLYQALQKELVEAKLKLQNDPQIQMGISYLIHQIAPGT